ncbi:hypothetical protein CONLIGDRAFT_627353 [Coniochaeta ligniaria NRRL 30616]|uniref:Uncharacterized protein n=1 Tax=Coniochaeta ligniaria NRRL 30616 TaxID=1408157 RepID=A0A1J7K4Z6_9PEZI|nr:hypothetical protein CONLIGDRAFT_627353 [Coniochaeta ligniaria NRRL 30616]
MDELMSDPAQPFGGSQDVDNSQKPAAWNTKKFREEYEIARSRLSDQKFDITQYADPLMPRRQSSTQSPATSQTFSPETEKRLQGLIAKIKSSTQTHGSRNSSEA